MKALIIEDEKLAAERLEELLIEIDPSIEIAGVIPSAEQSAKWLAQNKADLLFMDIQLSDGLCFSIFENVRPETPIIFTTAYDQYAIKVFKLNSIDYLLKPIRKTELEESLKKYKSLKSVFSIDIEDIFRSISLKSVSYKERFLIQYGGKIKKVETEDIAYFFALEKNVFITTFQNQTYPIDYTLDNLKEMVDPKKYFRINRKMIINFRAIKNMIPYSRSRIKVELTPAEPGDIEAIVSVERAAEFKNWLNI